MLKDIDLLLNKEISGLELLGQRFLIELFTEAKSIKFFPNRGCNFLKRLKYRCRTENDIINAFAAVKERIKKNLNSYYEEMEDFDANLISGVLLNKIILFEDKLKLHFIIKNKIGKMIRVITPEIKL